MSKQSNIALHDNRCVVMGLPTYIFRVQHALLSKRTRCYKTHGGFGGIIKILYGGHGGITKIL